VVSDRQPWPEVALGEIAEIVCGGTPKTTVPSYWVPEVNWVTAKDVSEWEVAKIGRIDRRISRLGLAESSAKLLPALSTVLIARGATMGKCRMIARPMAINQTCYGIVARAGTDPVYSTSFYGTGVRDAPPYRWSDAAPLPGRDSLSEAVEPRGGLDLLPGSGNPQDRLAHHVRTDYNILT
jgi:hypothetical protein